MRTAGWIALLSLLVSPAVAAPAPWSPPLNAYGVPDFDGFWTNSALTFLVRPANASKLVITDEEAKALLRVNGFVVSRQAEIKASDEKKAPTAAPSDGNVGGYNSFWTEPGEVFGRVDGQWRTSWIVDPPNGLLPFSDQGRALVAKARIFARDADTPVNPESLQPWDRCLIGSRGSGGPGMLNNIYNSNYQIVQSKDSIAIVVEMIHDVRTIPLFASKAEAQAAHRPAAMQPWLGDSVGWWEKGDLVIETTHVNAEQGRAGPIYLTPAGVVTERFRRTSPTETRYEFRVEDPTYYSQPWRAEMTLRTRGGRMFEYACHEGNYAMTDILRGARLAEAAKSTPAAGGR